MQPEAVTVAQGIKKLFVSHSAHGETFLGNILTCSVQFESDGVNSIDTGYKRKK